MHWERIYAKWTLKLIGVPQRCNSNFISPYKCHGLSSCAIFAELLSSESYRTDLITSQHRSGIGLVQQGLPKLILTQIYVALWRQLPQCIRSAARFRQISSTILSDVMRSNGTRSLWRIDKLQTCIVIWAWLEHHDDVIKWKHFPRYWPFVRRIHRSPVNSPHKGQWRGALMFTLICVWINGWVNNREAGDLRRNRAHYDVIVMYIHIPSRHPCKHFLRLLKKTVHIIANIRDIAKTGQIRNGVFLRFCLCLQVFCYIVVDQSVGVVKELLKWCRKER